VAIELTFAAPPSANLLFANAPGKGRVRTKAYKLWAQSAGWEIKTQIVPLPGMHHIDGPYALTIHIGPGLDIDNCAKGIADILGPGAHGMNVTEDDSQMVELHVYRDKAAGKTCRVRVEAKL